MTDYKIEPYANLCGANLYGADLYGANLREADLYGANLCGANLCGANLYGADLYGANLREADLYGANLYGANLYGANLREADLYGANLYGANLCGANLREADLCGADLYGANLREANLREADLYGANLCGAKLPHSLTVCPPEGSFIAWKALRNNVLAKLLIPANAKRSSATTRKCRASQAEVLLLIDSSGNSVSSAKSKHDGITEYRVGSTITPDKFDDDRWNECSHGIHFFMTKEEASEWM